MCHRSWVRAQTCSVVNKITLYLPQAYLKRPVVTLEKGNYPESGCPDFDVKVGDSVAPCDMPLNRFFSQFIIYVYLDSFV